MPIQEKHRDQVERLRKLAHLMDNSVGVPGTKLRFGLDPVLGIIPGVGDLAGALIASVIVFEARRMGVPRRVHAKMTMNVLIDALVGTVPIVGDLLDFGMKPNQKNLRMLQEALGAHRRGLRSERVVSKRGEASH